VAERSGASAEGATGTLKGRSELAELWLEHLLLLSMLQHTSGQWRWGRFVVVHPAGNSDYAELCARYRTLLEDRSNLLVGDPGGASGRRCPPRGDGRRPPRRYLPG
jgi:hypothetical protein